METVLQKSQVFNRSPITKNVVVLDRNVKAIGRSQLQLTATFIKITHLCVRSEIQSDLVDLFQHYGNA